MKNIFSSKIIVISIFILTLTFGLRFYQLGATSFVADEFLDINSTYGYQETGEWKAWDFNYGVPATQNKNDARDERANVYKWQVAQVLEHLSPTEANARLVSVLWGMISLLAIIFATWFWTGSMTTALVAGFLFAVSVSAIIFDRRLRMYAMFYPLYLLTSVFFFAALERVHTGSIQFFRRLQEKTQYHFGYGVLGVFFLGLAFLTHQLIGTIIFTLTAYLLVRAWMEWREKKGYKNVYMQSIALLTFLFGIASVMAPDFVRSFTAGLIWLDNHYTYWGHFWSDFEHSFLGLLVVLGGAWTLAIQKRTREGIFLALSAFVPLMLAVFFWRRNVGPQYIFMAQSFLLILAAAGVTGGATFLRDVTSGKIQKYIFGIAIALGLILLPHYSYFTAEENVYHQKASSENTNYRKLFSTFRQEHQAGEVLVTRNFRNYYFSGVKTPVYDFGGELSESDLQKSELEKLRTEYQHGWVILSKSDLDYVSGEAESYLAGGTFTVIKDPSVRGGNLVYRW
jgi:hypothetical protein